MTSSQQRKGQGELLICPCLQQWMNQKMMIMILKRQSLTMSHALMAQSLDFQSKNTLILFTHQLVGGKVGEKSSFVNFMKISVMIQSLALK